MRIWFADDIGPFSCICAIRIDGCKLASASCKQFGCESVAAQKCSIHVGRGMLAAPAFFRQLTII
jgi:hypothetical protein